MRWIRYAAVLSLLVLVAGCGESKDRAAEAEKIKQDLSAGFDIMFGKDKMKMVGYDKFEVVPDGDSYKATLSGVRIMPNEPEGPKLGDVTFNVEPKDADRYAISNLMLPSGVDIPLSDGQGKARFEIGSQQFSGVWSKTLAGFLDSDAAYKNITVTADQGVKFVIGEATMKQASTEKSAGIYDQTGNLAVKDMTVQTLEGTATIATITSTADAKGANLADLAKFRDQFSAVVAASAEDKPADPAAVEALKQMKAFFKDYVSKTELSNIVFKDASGQEAFKMDKVNVDGSWLGFDQPKSKFEIDMRFNGISAPSAAAMPEMAMFGQFIPGKFGLGVTIEDVPSSELWAAFLTVLTTPQTDPTAMDMAAEQAGMQVVQAAQQAGSNFKLNGWEYDSQGIKLKLGGSVKAEASAMMGAIASLNLELVGFDTILGMAQMFGGSDPSATAPLETLKQLSNRTTNGDGQPVDSFAVELANSGDVTVNGQPYNPFAMPQQ
jgi:hypothetical protein